MDILNDFVVDSGVLVDYTGHGGIVHIPQGIRRIHRMHTSGATEIYIPEGVTEISERAFCANSTLIKIVFPESLKVCGESIFDELCLVRHIGSNGSHKVQNPQYPTVICSDELLSILWKGLPPVFQLTIARYQLERQGKTSEEMAPAVREYVMKYRKEFLKDALSYPGDPAALKILLPMFGKLKLDKLDGYIESSQRNPELTAIFLEYKALHYSRESIERHETDKAEKAMGIKELSVADWRKLFAFKIEDGVARITKYKGSDTEVYVPDKIGKNQVVLGAKTFENNSTVEQVHILTNTTSVPNRCFYGCKNLTEVYLPESITVIEEFAFMGCSALNHINFPANLREIQESAFTQCTSLTQAVIPDNVEVIGEYAFSVCSGLSSLTVPASVSIANCAFKRCHALADEAGYVVVNGILFDCFNTDHTTCIPDGVVRISSEALNHDQITRVILPDSVKTIEARAFTCTNIESVHIPASVKKICAKAFDTYIGIPKRLLICAPTGSKAEKYAEKYKIRFMAK